MASPLPNTITRVMLADDHPIIHSGLDGMFFADTEVAIVGIATDFPSLLAKLETTSIDVLILDLMNMGAGPITMVRELRERYPALRILIFSSSTSLASEMLGAGALGYVVKEEKLNHLPAAIRAVAAGLPYLSPLVVEYQERAAAALRGISLKPREERVLRLVARGLTNREIATNLNIDRRTARNYINALYDKTGCETPGQLVVWYRQRYEGAIE